MSLAATPAAATASGATFKPLPASQGTSRSREAMNNTPERTRKNFNAYDRPIEWYRLPFAIKLAVLNLWRAERLQSRVTPWRTSIQQVRARRHTQKPRSRLMPTVAPPNSAA